MVYFFYKVHKQRIKKQASLDIIVYHENRTREYRPNQIFISKNAV